MACCSCLLCTGAADGCVRVWRAYLNHGLQRLATAWQAVPIRQPPALLRQGAAYALTEYPSLLYAAGGCHPDVLQVRGRGGARGRGDYRLGSRGLQQVRSVAVMHEPSSCCWHMVCQTMAPR